MARPCKTEQMDRNHLEEAEAGGMCEWARGTWNSVCNIYVYCALDMGLPHHQVRGREVGTSVHPVTMAALPSCSSSPPGQVQDLPGTVQQWLLQLWRWATAGAETSRKKTSVECRCCGKGRMPLAPRELGTGGMGRTMATELGALTRGWHCWCLFLHNSMGFVLQPLAANSTMSQSSSLLPESPQGEASPPGIGWRGWWVSKPRFVLFRWIWSGLG